MIAADVMNAPVITVKPQMFVEQLARLFFQRHISAVPVVDDDGKLIGIVSEADLMRRSEAGTERLRSWWLLALTGEETLASEYVRARGRKVGDVMTRHVITAEPNTPLSKIAALLEKNAIKRVPIVVNNKPIGIVSRANLLYALATSHQDLQVTPSDTSIRDKLLAHLKEQAWAHREVLNVTVEDGVVDLWGMADSEVERMAIRIAAENTPGVRGVNDHLTVWPVGAGN